MLSPSEVDAEEEEGSGGVGTWCEVLRRRRAEGGEREERVKRQHDRTRLERRYLDRNK